MKKQESKQKFIWFCIFRSSVFSATPQTAVSNKRSTYKNFCKYERLHFRPTFAKPLLTQKHKANPQDEEFQNMLL